MRVRVRVRYARATMPIPITDPDDPRIEAYRFVRERDLAGRGDRFVVEGEVVLRLFLARSRFAVELVLIADNRVEGLDEVLAPLPQSVPVYSASRSVMDAIVGFPIHRGILAIGQRGAPLAAGKLIEGLPDRALVVGLIGLANHDNVGGVFRNAAAFGADAVLLDAKTCDPLYRKAVRVSVGASLVVPFARLETPTEIVELLRRANFDILALSPAGREPLSRASRKPRAAILLGTEGQGLPQDVLADARTISIPMSGGFNSLNVATTSGIVLHHLARAFSSS